jgi:transcriptional regulator of aromatic amino acid metabolism
MQITTGLAHRRPTSSPAPAGHLLAVPVAVCMVTNLSTIIVATKTPTIRCLRPTTTLRHQNRLPEHRWTSGTPLRLQLKDAMAASLAAVKKELRNKIKGILKTLPEAAAATQSTSCHCAVAASTYATKHPMLPRLYSRCPSTRQHAE